jgi:hypothetical protein
MKPFSPEWHAREKAWADECNRRYEEAAQALVADGWERQAHDYYPAVFVKGDERAILVRSLGVSGPWHRRALWR